MLIKMNKKSINRVKAVLAEHDKTNKWLAKKLDKNETTISRWCTNEVQPSLETLLEISELLNIDLKELIKSNKEN
jgi:putative transcriptional regulator